jgi:LacI family transcriptional regulator
VLCATDRMAVGALHAIASAGLRAGRDVSVIGYDDLPMAGYTDPPLTTFEQPIPRMAQRMVEMLLALLDGADASQFREVWTPRLIARQTDGPAPKRIRRTGKQRANGGRHVQEARDPQWCDHTRPHDSEGTRR